MSFHFEKSRDFGKRVSFFFFFFLFFFCFFVFLFFFFFFLSTFSVIAQATAPRAHFLFHQSHLIHRNHSALQLPMWPGSAIARTVRCSLQRVPRRAGAQLGANNRCKSHKHLSERLLSPTSAAAAAAAATTTTAAALSIREGSTSTNADFAQILY
jgi:hypothetical protein